jgi:hypothetical protein
MIGLFTRVFMAAFIAVLMTGGAAHAQVVLSSTDFNSFSLGSVNGQGGWGITGGYDQEVVNVGIGDNALRVSNRTMSGSFSDQLFAPRPGVFVGESSTANSYSPVISNHLNVSFRFSTATQAVQDDARSTFSTDDGTGGRQSFIALRGCGAGQVCVDTFDVLPDGSFAGPIQLAAGLTGWHTLAIDLQFNDGPGNDVVQYLIDGVVVHTNTSWEEYYTANQPLLHPFGVANQTLLIRESSGPCANRCDGFLLDDVVVTTVPEPMTLALLGIGFAGIVSSRRRKGAFVHS